MAPTRPVLLALLAALLLNPVAAKRSHAQRQPAAPKAESKKLTTKDGVKLHVKYYPSSAGREAAPVVLIHDLKESGQVYSRLARRLQQPQEGDTHKSFAVVAVDLRGHGDSRQQEYKGRTRELDAAKLGMADMRAMVLGDMEAVRKFLVEENDKGKLNLNRLSLVGSGMGAVVAANFAARDWAMRELATVKQSKDVKALALVSPPWKAKGLAMQNAVRQEGVQSKVAILLLYGAEDRGAKRDVDRIYAQLERGHPELRSDEETPTSTLVKNLPIVTKIGAKTKLQGSQWLAQSGEKGDTLIARFLAKHSSDSAFEYSKRRPE